MPKYTVKVDDFEPNFEFDACSIESAVLQSVDEVYFSGCTANEYEIKAKLADSDVWTHEGTVETRVEFDAFLHKRKA